MNKIVGAVLLAGVIAMVSGLIAEGLYTGTIGEHHGEEPKRGYSIAGADVEPMEGAAAVEEKPVDIAEFMAKADANAGKALLNKCTSCHTFDKGGRNGVGPNQFGLVGSSFAHTEGFNYSQALAELKGKKRWGHQELSDFLAAPARYIPGTKMSFAGIKNPQDRANLIAYLSTLK